jgi:hypothetical protein
MAKQTINIGTVANDRSGDPLRTAFTKVNQNFTELYNKDATDFSGSYNDLTNKPNLSIYQLANTAFSGDYNDLDNKPTISNFTNGEDDLVLPGSLIFPDTTTQTTAFTLNPALESIVLNGLSRERIVEKQNAGVVTYDCSEASVFFHASPSVDWTVNLVNFGLDDDYSTTITIIIDQFDPGHHPSVLRIDGNTQTIRWHGGVEPTPSTFAIDVVSFKIFKLSGGGGYSVVGQLVGTVPEAGETTLYSDFSFGIITNLANTGNSKSWTFEENGGLTLPASGIITAPDDEFFKLQAKDTDSLLRNEINLDPNNGTYMSVWSGELDTAFSTDDWATASWQNNGGQGYVIITNAENLVDFWTTGPGSIVNSIEVSINGGARTPVQYYGDNDEQYDVELSVTAIPGSTTEITSLIFYYQTKSSINIDYDNGRMLLEAQSMNITLETSDDIELRSGGELKLRSAGQDSVRIYTDNSTYMWDFNNTGDLTLPREGKIYGIGDGPAGDRGGYISWAGNSSGDGSGFNTMRLVPDQQGLEEADQYIILDPTSPGHIHIRAGGTQDNSQAILYFGGENSHVKINSGPNPPVTVMSANNSWTFGTDGGLQFPDTTEQTTAFTTSPTLNVLKIDDGVHEKFQELADATGTVTHDCSSGQIFYHSSPDANWTVNLTNLNLSSGYATTVTLVIDQSETGYYPNALQIGGSAQTINWQGNATPTPSTSRQDVVSFSILAVTGGYIVFGQLTGF